MMQEGNNNSIEIKVILEPIFRGDYSKEAIQLILSELEQLVSFQDGDIDICNVMALGSFLELLGKSIKGNQHLRDELEKETDLQGAYKGVQFSSASNSKVFYDHPEINEVSERIKSLQNLKKKYQEAQSTASKTGKDFEYVDKDTGEVIVFNPVMIQSGKNPRIGLPKKSVV